MDDAHAQRILEALLFVSGQPLAFKRIAEAVPELDAATIRRLLERLKAEYTASGRAFQLQEVAGGYQFVTDPALAAWVTRALETPRPETIRMAALETLALVAYRQPVTKAEIEVVRGVDATASLDTLLERRLIRIAGRKESPGRPFLYKTTVEFLRQFGLSSLEALPTFAVPVVPETPLPSSGHAAVEPDGHVGEAGHAAAEPQRCASETGGDLVASEKDLKT